MATQPLTVDQFAASIKAKYPQYDSIPDAQLVEKIVAKYPQYKSRIGGAAPQPPGVPSAPPIPFADRVIQRLSENAKGVAQMPSDIITDARSRYDARRGKEFGPLNAAHSAFEAVESKGVEPALQGLYSVSTPGLIGRMSSKEDPAITAADLGTFFATSGEEPVRGALEGGAKLLDKILGKVGGATRILGQEMAGAGKEPVYLERLRRFAVANERLERYKGDVDSVIKENAQRLQEHSSKAREAQAVYQKELADYQQATADKKAAHAEKVKVARDEWVQKAYEAKRLQAQHDSAQAQLDTIKRGQEAYAKIVKQNVDSTYAAVKGSLDQRWKAVNDTVGTTTPINSVAVRDAIEAAKEKYLMGAPESLKVFNDLTRQMQGPEQLDAASGIEQSLRPLTWGEGRVHYSALGDKMYSGELPGNVYHALGAVRDALDRQLSDVAKARGAGKMYDSVRADWSRFMDDWRDMRSISVGGSPLARVMRAQDPGFVAAQITGKAGERMAATLGHYKQFGGNPEAVSKYRALGDRAKSVPKVRVPAAPGKLELPPEPKTGEAPTPSTVKAAKLKPAPRFELPKEVDPVEVRRRKLAEMAGRPFRFYDLFPPYLIEHLAVKSPAIREWLATQTRQELKP